MNYDENSAHKVDDEHEANDESIFLENKSGVEYLAIQVNNLTTKYERLLSWVSQISDNVDDLDCRLGMDLERRTRQRTDLNDSDKAAHFNIANSYLTFVEQKLQGVAQRHYRHFRKGRRAQSAEQIALLMSELSRQFFKGHIIDVEAIRNLVDTDDPRWLEDVERLTVSATIMIGQVDRTGVASPWDFGMGRRDVLDSARQKLWGACDPYKKIKFVVAPGYTVGGTQYCHQLVFTGE
ncbi:hypothetical protein ACFQO7_33200 [Catellatospora aurea]|uniref:Uncharacterized protein n=1 Tax=Catellatospora aurea TaxID=1337874 RepID=A0ABW2H9J1_9ACTN